MELKYYHFTKNRENLYFTKKIEILFVITTNCELHVVIPTTQLLTEATSPWSPEQRYEVLSYDETQRKFIF